MTNSHTTHHHTTTCDICGCSGSYDPATGEGDIQPYDEHTLCDTCWTEAVRRVRDHEADTERQAVEDMVEAAECGDSETTQTWLVTDGQVTTTYEAASAADAVREALRSYDRPLPEEGSAAICLAVAPVADQEVEEDHRVVLDPAEPPCSRDHDHDWQAPHDVVAGIEDNPGVVGHGSGVMVTEVCARCGCYRVTDTAATDECGETYTRLRYIEADDASLAWVEEEAAR